MEEILALEMIRVTEAAAIDSARLMGRGDNGRDPDVRAHRDRRG
jgi:fructose-1,6-bisphosphatase/sedoheptulose 1,7-bisphosphatase-like protein